MSRRFVVMLTEALMPPPVEYAHASAGAGDTGKPLGSALALMIQSNPTVRSKIRYRIQQ
jgi:hypothetical protein